MRPVEPRIVVLGPDATQVVPTRAAPSPSADETQVVPAASADQTQVLPPSAPADRESPTDVAVELTDHGTPVDPAAGDGPADDLARQTRNGGRP
ncbi:hypothetical protein [Spirilliplanes yamanashiensis]|uniref:hypothetical protein n=1 Tax=Spirilliplanes yamanashiensis TaxID=42233 RepID=UPI0035202585